MVQTVKRLPAMQETQVRFLGLEDPLEKEMSTRSSILAWRIPWTEEPSRLQSVGPQESDMTEQLKTILICNMGLLLVNHRAETQSGLPNFCEPRYT